MPSQPALTCSSWGHPYFVIFIFNFFSTAPSPADLPGSGGVPSDFLSSLLGDTVFPPAVSSLSQTVMSQIVHGLQLLCGAAAVPGCRTSLPSDS